MSYESNNHREREHDNEPLYSKRLKAGKRRTYFFDVRATRGNDYFLTITESKKKFNDDGYDRHKIFLYKEDFNKFIDALTDAVDHVKTELLPDFDFDSFSHDDYEHHEHGDNYQQHQNGASVPEAKTIEVESTEAVTANSAEEPVTTSEVPSANNDVEVDKW